MISIIFGLLSALTWGAADFSGGLVSKQANVFGVVIGGQATGLMLLLVLTTLLGEPAPPLAAWLWGGAAGLAGGIGLSLLYQALANGRMSVAAPVSALLAAIIPVTSILAYALVKKQPWRPGRAHWPLVALSGILDLAGNSFYILAGQIGRMDVAAVLGSLYPGSTVALARLVLKERITRLQAVGILAALVAIVLIALGTICHTDTTCSSSRVDWTDFF